MTVFNVMNLRLRSMYASPSVKSLAVIVLILIMVLISGLYEGAENSSKLKVGIHFEYESRVTEEIMASLEDNEILLPVVMSPEEGKKAVEEGRIQGFYEFGEDLEQRIAEGDYEEVVELYILKENFVAYLISDVVGSELIGEIAVLKAMEYMKEVLDETDTDVGDRSGFMDRFYAYGKGDLAHEKDNFNVKKTYIIPEDGKDLSYVALENVLLFKQVILGIVYVFVAFFMLFLVVNMVRDDEMGLRPKWMTTPMSRLQIVIGEYFSIIIGSLPMIAAVTAVQGFYEDKWFFFLLINLLYAAAYTGILMFVGKILRKVTVYVVLSSALIIVLGIVSGSFFLLNTDQALMALLSYMIPASRLLDEVVRVQLIQENLPSAGYMGFMLLYAVVMFGLAALVDRIRFRRY